MQNRGREDAKSSICTGFTIFINQTRDTVVTACLGKLNWRARFGTTDVHVFFEGTKQTITQTTSLPRHFQRAHEVDWQIQFTVGDIFIRGKRQTSRLTTNPSCIHHRVWRTAITDPATPRVRPWGSNKNLLSFDKKQPLFRKESFRSTEIDYNIIRLNRPKVRVDGA